MCRVCLKRPEIPDERYGRCEACAKSGRIALRFRLGPGRGGPALAVKAGEISPRALHQKWLAPLTSYQGHPAAKSHLGLHEVEVLTARDRLESIRVAPDLAGRGEDVLDALRAAAQRSDASW
jgi:hypothetical protein